MAKTSFSAFPDLHLSSVLSLLSVAFRKDINTIYQEVNFGFQ